MNSARLEAIALWVLLAVAAALLAAPGWESQLAALDPDAIVVQRHQALGQALPAVPAYALAWRDDTWDLYVRAGTVASAEDGTGGWLEGTFP